jgi:hypothetical protein
MGVAGVFDVLESKSALNIRELMHKQFETHLIALGLSKGQIEKQNVTELHQSLDRVKDAMQHPESFGVVKVEGNAAVFKYNYEASIFPLLLERKSLIIDRLKVLEKKEEIVDLREKAESAHNQEETEEYEKKIKELQTAIITIEEKYAKSEEAMRLSLEEAQSDVKKQELAERKERLKLETWERRTQIFQRFLERESVATIVGGMLLVLVTLFMIVVTIWNMKALDILSNAFLVILGYFFGQSVGRASIREKEEGGNGK